MSLTGLREAFFYLFTNPVIYRSFKSNQSWPPLSSGIHIMLVLVGYRTTMHWEKVNKGSPGTSTDHEKQNKFVVFWHRWKHYRCMKDIFLVFPLPVYWGLQMFNTLNPLPFYFNTHVLQILPVISVSITLMCTSLIWRFYSSVKDINFWVWSNVSEMKQKFSLPEFSEWAPPKRSEATAHPAKLDSDKFGDECYWLQQVVKARWTRIRWIPYQMQLLGPGQHHIWWK